MRWRLSRIISGLCFLRCGWSGGEIKCADWCGRSREDAVAELSEKVPNFLAFPDLDKAVVEDVEYLKKSNLVPEDVAISGWVYDVESGKTRRVV